MYFQVLFAIDRVKALAPQHPEWKEKEPFKSVLTGDMKSLAASGQKGLLEIIAATHAGMTVDEFHVTRPRLDAHRPPSEVQPAVQQVHLSANARSARIPAHNGFKTFIVSGGGVEFMRPWVEQAYGIPPEQVIGSSGVVKFEMQATVSRYS